VAGLEKLFNPRSIAVVGASSDTKKIRGRVLANVINAGFTGSIYPVNPSAQEIQGLKAFPSIADLPEKVDLAIVAVSAGQVLATLDECAAAGVGSAIVFASGFAEGGDDSAQREITDLASRSGMRILGPNTVGFDNEYLGIGATFSPVTTERTKKTSVQYAGQDLIDIVCQSGGLGFALSTRALERGVHVRYTITTGNEADCETLEIVEHLLLQGGSKAILLFVEGFRNPERLERCAKLAAERKVPLIVAKMGRSDAGQRAALSHTAHLTGSDVICDAIFERDGVIRAADPEEMMAMAAALTGLPSIRGNKISIITTSGGTGGWAADILSDEGLSISEPSEGLRKKLDALIPGFGSSANPIDVTANVVEDGGIGLAMVIEAIAESGEFDAALFILSLVGPGRIATMRERLAPVLKQGSLPIIFHSPGIPSPDNIEELRRLKALQMSLRDAGVALRTLHRYGAFQYGRNAASHTASPAKRFHAALDRSDWASLDRRQLRDLLDGYGIATPAEAIVSSPDEAAAIADTIGFPLAMKIESRDIPHKSDAGCVVLGVADAVGCAAAYSRILDNARRYDPGATIEGVLLQRMMPPGLEMVVGMTTDPDFGAMIVLGFGGIYVEILRDSVVMPAPLSLGAAMRMIERLKGVEILKGARGKGPVDIVALAQVMVGLSNLIEDAGDAIREVDFNPVILYPAGQGAAVVDYLIVPNSTGHKARTDL
jgi:acetate---CoA ligase (ADP-forming)